MDTGSRMELANCLEDLDRRLNHLEEQLLSLAAQVRNIGQ
jgi:hypothetical protein